MKTCPPVFITALSVALLLLPAAASAQVTSTRLHPQNVDASASAGGARQASAVGAGRLALGVPRGLNRTGVRSGVVHLYDENTGRYSFTLQAPDGAANDGFGSAISISGHHIAIGAPGCDVAGHTNSGAVYVFDLRSRRLVQKMGDGYFMADEAAGGSLAIEGNLVAIGVEAGNFGRGVHSGAVVLWRISSPSAEAVITDPSGAAGDLFGYSVAMHGGVLAVGAPKADLAGGAANAGAVSLFDAEDRTFYTRVTRSAPVADDAFGFSVALDRNTLYAGAPRAAGGSGVVASWDLYQLHAPMHLNEASGSGGARSFGAALSAHQSLLVVGAPTTAAPGSGGAVLTGSVHLMDRELRETTGALQPSDLRHVDGFGMCVALFNNTLVVGAPGDDTWAVDGGAMWKFSKVAPLVNMIMSDLSHLTRLPTGIGATTFGYVVQSAGSGVEPISITTLAGPGTSGGRNQALWSPYNPGGSLALVAQTGVADFTGIRFTRFQSVVVNEIAGSLFVRATRSGPGITSANNSGIFRSNTSATALSPLLTTGMTMRDGERIAAIRQFRVNSNFDSTATTVALRSGTGSIPVSSRSDTGIVITSGGSVAALLREGVAMSPLGTPYGQMPAQFSVSGDRMFAVHTAQLGSGVTTANNSFVSQNMVAVARKGDMAPGEFGHPLGAFSSFSAATGSDIGVVFRGVMRTGGGITSANNEGLWTNRDHTLRLVLRKGDAAPGLPSGVTVRRFIRHGMNTSGSILMLVQVRGSGVTAANDLVLYLNRFVPGGSSFQLLLREGQTVPGTGGARLGSISKVDFTAIPTFSNSHYAVQAALISQAGLVSARNNLVWIVGSASTASVDGPAVRRPQVVLQKGVRFLSLTPNAVTSFSTGTALGGTDGSLNNGSGHALGINFGRSTLKVRFATGQAGAASIDL